MKNSYYMKIFTNIPIYITYIVKINVNIHTIIIRVLLTPHPQATQAAQ
jgi:hypothetical protein